MPRRKKSLLFTSEQDGAGALANLQQSLFGPDPELMEQLAKAEAELVAEAKGPKTFTVSEVTRYLQSVIDEDPILGGTLVVRGEVSNVKRSSRGHVYFTLKDEDASLNGILWAGVSRTLAFDLKDGLEVYVTGNLEIYVPSGTYSLVAKKMEPVGVGALQLAFQQIKERLEAEGLFLQEHKKPLPEFPRKIGIVTSRTGAVIHDMLRVIRRKNPNVDVLLAPVKVQGDGAAVDIAEAIRELNDPRYELDVLIVGRGGGSFEDLFCFSEEPVVRAVFESRIPIVTGIGHEPDYALADAAADYSAATPTMAAEYAVPDLERLIEDFKFRRRMLVEEAEQILMYYEQYLDMKATALVDTHGRTLDMAKNYLEGARERFVNETRMRLQKYEQHLGQCASALQAFSPLDTQARGYALAMKDDGSLVQSVAQAKPGDALTLKLTDGQLRCEVIDNNA